MDEVALVSDGGEGLVNERSALLKAQSEARATSKRGLLLLISVPVVDLVAGLIVVSELSAILAVFTFLFAAVFTVAGVIRALALIATGSVQHHKATAQLAFLERRTLPEARLIVR
jgi:uncharacterized membrane protein HdeD (DUF308 family)